MEVPLAATRLGTGRQTGDGGAMARGLNTKATHWNRSKSLPQLRILFYYEISQSEYISMMLCRNKLFELSKTTVQKRNLCCNNTVISALCRII